MSAASILADLHRAVDETDSEAAVAAVASAFRTILREHDTGRISAGMRARLLDPFWTVAAAAEAVLPEWYWAERGRHGFISVYSMLDVWAELPGSQARREGYHPSMALLARILVNDLDNLVAAFALRRSNPGFPPMSVLMPLQPPAQPSHASMH